MGHGRDCFWDPKKSNTMIKHKVGNFQYGQLSIYHCNRDKLHKFGKEINNYKYKIIYISFGTKINGH